MTIFEHAEAHLGPMDRGWVDKKAREEIRIVSFADCPVESVTTFLSLGLSEHVLDISRQKRVRQELVFSVRSMDIPDLIVSFLLSLCESMARRGDAVLRGEVIPLSGDLAKRIGFEAVYCAIPVHLDEEFSLYESLPPTVVVWVLPVHRSEVSFIEAHGWESFEDLLERQEPDLCSLQRAPVV